MIIVTVSHWSSNMLPITLYCCCLLVQLMPYARNTHLTGRSTWVPYFNSTSTHSVSPSKLAQWRADWPYCSVRTVSMNNICCQCTRIIEIFIFYLIFVVHICAKIKQHCDLFNTSCPTRINQAMVDISSLYKYRDCTLMLVPLEGVSPFYQGFR